jgi:hypothetical protein
VTSSEQTQDQRDSMVSTRRQKQALVEASDPLKDAGILRHVLTFLPGNWLILGAVCRDWQAVYAGIADQQLCGFSVRSILSTRIINREVVMCGTRTTRFSAAVASPAIARLALSCRIMMSDSLQLAAGLHADTVTLIVLRQLGMPLSVLVITAVAVSGRLHIMQQLLRDPQCPTLQPGTLSHCAARSGSISMLNWLRAEGLCGFIKDTCAGAAEWGHLPALQYLHSEGCVWDAQDIARRAARSGSIDLVEWLRQQQGIEFDALILACAAGAGQTAMCEHLRSVGCDWDTSACGLASVGGHLNTLRWLREHDCPWDVRDVCFNAVETSYVDILDYVMEQGQVLDAELLTAVLNHAGAYNQLAAAQWLRQHGAEWRCCACY